MNSSPSVDSVTPPAPENTPKAAQTSAPSFRRARLLLILALSIPYILYICWSFFLIAVLPDRSGFFDFLIPVGKMGAMLGFLSSVAFITLGLVRIRQAKTVDSVRLVSVLTVIGVIIPIFIASGLVFVVIDKEPKLTIAITEPQSVSQFIAPLPITFNVEEEVAILERRGLRPISFSWDFNGDGNVNQTVVVPTATAYYEKQGVYSPGVTVQLSDGSSRYISRRFAIPNQQFSYAPDIPIVDEPVTFSIAHLLEDGKEIKEVRWDFTGDGNVDEVSQSPEATYTFIKTGDQKVAVTVILTNQVRQTYERLVPISDPPPLPFDIAITTEPELLMSPAPFQVLFTAVTDEPLREVKWDFGDGEIPTEGQRVGHTFRDKGVIQVKMTARAESGEIAELVKMVRIVEQLTLPDLRIEGSHTVKKDTIVADLPAEIELTPRTALPLVSFRWEAPHATIVDSTNETLRATYRRPGTYTITLVAQDADRYVMRKPYILEVKPPVSQVTIRSNPNGGVAPLTVNFDASETVIQDKIVNGFEWDFGEKDFNPQQGSARMTYIYDKPGTYEVTLIAVTTIGERFEAKKTIVVRPPNLEAYFTSSRTQGTLSPDGTFGVTFDRSGSQGNFSSLEWDFGDGWKSSDTDEDIIHVYEKPGVYQVTLKLFGENGNASVFGPVLITVRSP